MGRKCCFPQHNLQTHDDDDDDEHIKPRNGKIDKLVKFVTEREKMSGESECHK